MRIWVLLKIRNLQRHENLFYDFPLCNSFFIPDGPSWSSHFHLPPATAPPILTHCTGLLILSLAHLVGWLVGWFGGDSFLHPLLDHFLPDLPAPKRETAFDVLWWWVVKHYKSWYIYHGIALSNPEGGWVSIHPTTWMNFQRVTLSEKDIWTTTPFIKYSWITKSRYGEQISVCQGFGTGVGKWIWTTEGILEVMTLFCILNVALSIFWLWFCTIVLQTVTADGNWLKDSWDLPIL